MYRLKHTAKSYRLLLVLPVCLFLSMSMVAGSARSETSVPVAGQPLAVPAEFIRFVKAPGAADFIKRPTAVHWDRFHRELLVADSGHNRVLVFTASGAYKFEFSLGDVVTAPADMVTDPAGFIYVLGSNSNGRVLQRFDFDGLFLGPVPMPTEIAGQPVNPRSLACGADGRLYLLDNKALRVLVVDPAVGVVGNFGISSADASDQALFGLGTIAVSGDQLLIPVATEGTVLRYGLDGEPRGTFGHFGAKPGTLNFPVAVAVSPEGVLAVLDQGRFCVVCYNTDGKVLGEFGGKGQSPGWFVNPSLLVIPAADRVVVGQIFENKIQICALPEFVRGRNRASAEDSIDPQDQVDPTRTDDPRHTVRPSNFPSSGSADPQNLVPVSHLEVSE